MHRLNNYNLLLGCHNNFVTPDNRQGADDVLDTAQRVLEALKRASDAQDAAHNAIARAEEDIRNAEQDLIMVSTHSDRLLFLISSSLFPLERGEASFYTTASPFHFSLSTAFSLHLYPPLSFQHPCLHLH